MKSMIFVHKKLVVCRITSYYSTPLRICKAIKSSRTREVPVPEYGWTWSTRWSCQSRRWWVLWRRVWVAHKATIRAGSAHRERAPGTVVSLPITMKEAPKNRWTSRITTAVWVFWWRTPEKREQLLKREIVELLRPSFSLFAIFHV